MTGHPNASRISTTPMLTSLPNLLTLSRIGLIPLMIALMYVDTPENRWMAWGIFTVACATDWLDGYLARNMNDVSSLGRFLDPIADKLLITSVIVMLTALGRISDLVVIPAIIILCRELLVSGLREYLAEINVEMPVSKLAKWKTVIQMIALGTLIVGDAGPSSWPVQTAGEWGMWIAGALTVITGYVYMASGLKHMLGSRPKT